MALHFLFVNDHSRSEFDQGAPKDAERCDGFTTNVCDVSGGKKYLELAVPPTSDGHFLLLSLGNSSLSITTVVEHWRQLQQIANRYQVHEASCSRYIRNMNIM
jgi:hypothetical protein